MNPEELSKYYLDWDILKGIETKLHNAMKMCEDLAREKELDECDIMLGMFCRIIQLNQVITELKRK